MTQALGLNNNNDVVGFYVDTAGSTHGFILRSGHWQGINDPHGVGSTVVNGVDNKDRLVGFYGNVAGGISHGFVATP